jgi:hypothetical protein
MKSVWLTADKSPLAGWISAIRIASFLAKNLDRNSVGAFP